MPLLSTETIIKQYYEKVKDKYPTITYEIFEAICKAPFQFFNKCLAREDLPTVHIRGLGRFVVLPFTVKELIKRNDKKLRFKDIDEELHAKNKTRLENLLSEIEKYYYEEQDIEFDEG